MVEGGRSGGIYGRYRVVVVEEEEKVVVATLYSVINTPSPILLAVNVIVIMLSVGWCGGFKSQVREGLLSPSVAGWLYGFCF